MPACPGTRDIEAMIAFIEQRMARPFRWGTQDCVRFAASAVQAETGENLLAGVPRWSSRREALSVLDQLGGLIAAVDARRPRIPAAFALRGDIAGIEDSLFGVRLMIVEGATLIGPGQRGLERLPREAMEMAWSATGPRSAIEVPC